MCSRRSCMASLSWRAQLVEPVAHRQPGRPGLGAQRVDLVAQRRELLGDAVMDVAGDAVALLETRELAQRPEEQAGLERRCDATGDVARDLALGLGEVAAVGTLGDDDGRGPVAQVERHDERAPAAELVDEGHLGGHPARGVGAQQGGDVLGDVPRGTGRAAQGDGHEVLGVLRDEDGAAGRRHLGGQQVEGQGGAGRCVEAGGHLRREVLEPLDQLDGLAGGRVGARGPVGGEAAVPGAEEAEPDGRGQPQDELPGAGGLGRLERQHADEVGTAPGHRRRQHPEAAEPHARVVGGDEHQARRADPRQREPGPCPGRGRDEEGEDEGVDDAPARHRHPVERDDDEVEGHDEQEPGQHLLQGPVRAARTGAEHGERQTDRRRRVEREETGAAGHPRTVVSPPDRPLRFAGSSQTAVRG